MERNFYKKPNIHSPTNINYQSPDTLSEYSYRFRSTSKNNQSNIYFPGSESEFSYERQACCFRTFAAKDKLKNSHVRKSMKEVTVGSPEENSNIAPVKIRQLKSEQKDEEIEKLKFENRLLRSEIKRLKKQVEENNRNKLKQILPEPSEEERKSLHRTINQLSQNLKMNGSTERYDEELNHNFFNLSDSLRESKDDEIVNLLKDAEQQIRDKNDQIQELQHRLQQLQSLSFVKSKPNNKYLESEVQKQKKKKDQFNSLFVDLRDKLRELGNKQTYITDRIDWLQKQMMIMVDKFSNILQLIKKNQVQTPRSVNKITYSSTSTYGEM